MGVQIEPESVFRLGRNMQACGSGNFLIIAYRELRSLEMRIFQREDELDGGQAALRFDSGVKLSNFYGIELADFAAETAKLSMWIAEYQMNQRFKSLFGEAPPDFPLKEGGHITHGNALRVDWLKACPSSDDEDTETYIVGNPPYLGSTWQGVEQKADMEQVFSPFTKTFKNLDYVTAWYLKGAEYCAAQNAQCAFVATNSICQGEQVALLWPLIFQFGMEISFAHQSFKWKNLAASNAAVTCVIVGLRSISNQKKTLFHDGIARQVKHIGPYLIEMPNIIVHKASKPLNSLPPMEYGNKPVDGGNLILSPREKDVLLEQYPEAQPLIRRLYGSQELSKGIERWCLWIKDQDLLLAQSVPPIADRIEKVRQMRLASKDSGANKMAARAHQFREMNDFSDHGILFPAVTSGERLYLQASIVDSNSIATNRNFQLSDQGLWIFSILSSKIHYVWTNTVGGKFKTDFNYSSTLVYNTFPIPLLSTYEKKKLEDHAWEIISARETYTGKTIAWLYNPKTMPNDLLVAHKTLDDTLEKIYIGRPFKDDSERLEHLFKLYVEMTEKEKKRKTL